MGSDRFCLGILPVGEIDPIAARKIAGAFSDALDIKTVGLAPLPHPDYAFDRRRIQYDAGRIISDLETMEFQGCDKVIALIDLDLFIPVFSFVLGDANVGGRCALVSLFRLDQNHERAVKVTLHEFGHLLDIGHCSEKGCVMEFSKNIEQLDMISPFFCSYCLGNIRPRLEK